MKKNGYTLIEVLMATIILAVLLSYVLNFLYYYNAFIKKIESNVDIQENMKIAADFLYENIIKAQNIDVEKDFLLIDGKRIYIKDNILRYDTDSQQIASGISKIEIKKIEDIQNLYFLSLHFKDKVKILYILNRSDVYD
ncbi:MAG: type II secretion system GspH family protein [Caloramator sp.]|nr:type II secretion system GspH family protein [Caloramator sp.]